MDVTVTAWPDDEPANGPAIRDLLHREGLSPSTWSNASGYRYGVHSHPYHKVLYCVRGTIRFAAGGASYDLRPGGPLDIPPGTPHSAIVGAQGVTCMEAGRIRDAPA